MNMWIYRNSQDAKRDTTINRHQGNSVNMSVKRKIKEILDPLTT